ncbi:MAG TPA: hypothetical protein VIF15_06600 [Polyangiaceae bacterium]
MSPARHLLSLVRGSYRAVRYVASHTPLRLGIFAGLALIAAWPLLSTANSLNEFRDAHVLGHYEAVARDTVLHWGQAPLWDPYYCGGMYLLGTPQARFVSPTFLLTLVFGETRAEALTAFAMILAGLEGTYRYARSRRATRFGAMAAAPLFALSGIFATSPALGWFSFFGFQLLPWMALGTRRALAGERMGLVTTAVAAAWCVGFGGTYAAPIAALWCAFEVGEHVVRHARTDRAGVAAVTLGLGVAAATAALGAGLAAVRLWPIADTLQAAPRIIGGAPGNDWGTLARMFLWPIRPETDNGEFFIGVLGLPAVLLGLLRRRRSIPLAVAGVACVWLAAGYAVRPSLFASLRELPLYTTLRYPERFLVPLALACATLAAQGVSLAEAYVRTPRARQRRRRERAGKALLLVASVGLAANLGPLAAQHALHARDRSLSSPPGAIDDSRPFHQARGNRWALAYYEPMQRGSLSCWEAYPVPESPLLRGDRQSEEWLVEPGAGTVTERSWSPNRIELDVALSRPATVAVNQNWHAGWRASAGTIENDRGLLTVALPAGTHALSLRFAPRSATGGALASLVALLALGVVVRQARRSPKVRGAREGLVLALLALSPLVPVVATAALVHEAAYVQAPLTPDGRPVVADDIDEGAVRIDAKFADGVSLEAATLSNPDPAAGAETSLELDWRRDGRVAPGLGVFVHIEPSTGGTNINGDHVLLSSVLDLEDAPSNKTLRDVLPIFLPDDARGKTWKVWVGLWRVRRGGERVHLEDAGHALSDGDRVLVATFVAR